MDTDCNPIYFDEARCFLEYLDPIKLEEWNGWYFRGQPDASFELKPSVWRKESDALFERFLAKNKFSTKAKDEWFLRIKFENYLLSSFYETANHAGLVIPKTQLKRAQKYPPEYWIKKQYKKPRLSSDPILFETSLPQHHGLPTRSLDWSINPRIAAFFAGYTYLSRRNREAIKHIAVYAIKIINNRGLVRKSDTHAKYENKFLYAQEGLFTQIYGDAYFLEKGRWPSIDAIHQAYGNKYFKLKKIVLSVKCVDDLLSRLNASGISISKMMPDYRHVGEQVKWLG